ncbi:MAG: dipeptidase [Pirellula sp.]|nr:dipeptidase [Pirellula sp.]
MPWCLLQRCWQRLRILGVLAYVLIIPQVQAQSPSGPSRGSVEISDAAWQIHARSYVFDGHNDLPWEVRTNTSRGFDEIDLRKPQPQFHTDIDRLRLGNVGAQFWSVYVPADTVQTGTSFQTTVEQIRMVKDMIDRYPDVFELALNAEDVDRIRAQGKIASLIGMEGGHSMEGSLGKLRQLYNMGARYMTLTHSDSLDWADAATDVSKNDGLSAYGEEVVREMNRLGMIVDLSHVSPATMHDALDISTAPVIFSHSSARAVADHPRNVPDDVLRRLPDNGGVVLINFFSGFVVPESAKIMQNMFQKRRELKKKYPNSKVDVEREFKAWQVANPYPAGEVDILVDHIEHVIRVAGIDHVGLGSDFDGVAKLPRGMEDVSKYPVLTEILLQRGYSETDIHKIMSGNLLRVLRQVTSPGN